MTRTSRTGFCKGFLRLLAMRAGRRPMRSERTGEPAATRQFVQDGERRVLLEAGDDAAAGLVELRPPAIIVVAEVEDIGGARLDRHRLGGGDVVDAGRA